MDLFLANFANVDSLIQVWPLLAQGLAVTLQLVVVCLPLAALSGLTVGVAYSFAPGFLRRCLVVGIDLLRSFPVLVLLIVIYYSLPAVGIKISAFWAVVLALVLNNTGYFGEIFRAGLVSLDKGQTEAAQALGFGPFKMMFWILLPQALRRVAAPCASNALELVKGTSIASIVALPELLRSANVAQQQVYNPTPLTATAIIFFVLLWPFSRWVSVLERRAIMRRG
ncbi:amino acid ABC transporter permease [Sinirhodobacter populi]|uniref:Amino acid ABC transporter permease n=1 Tax=Paenirhodobacter populi TaxID=2306993 RepID=A0A443K053_9RHOB|nr:amino acid ABC transporter permease [Sinirhodobacter populi]RWR26172.1 amino acid ABC transporter permease [Sinirhodobacter populi]